MNRKLLKQSLLDELYAPYGNCMLCPLAQERTHVVFGRGNPDATLLIVGEGPGKEEDLQGLPFVGRSGKLLTKALNQLEIPQDTIYISNIVKCRPPQNRAPSPAEATTCMNALLNHQIKIIQPRVICTLGATATQFLLNTKAPLADLRGKIIASTLQIPIVPTFHPAYILRKPSELENLLKDLTLVKNSFLL